MRTGVKCVRTEWQTGNGEDTTGGAYWTVTDYITTVNKTQFKNVETGTVVNESCAFSGTWNGSGQTKVVGAGSTLIGTGYEPYCYDYSGNKPTTLITQTLTVPPCPF